MLYRVIGSKADVIPTGIQLGADKFFTSETVGTFRLQVTRTGDVSGSTSVNYTTSDGTATAGATTQPQVVP